jgi:3-isopropylmalate/(R)-2-methylmalate dehydratase large subunit
MVADHTVPTRDRRGIVDAENREALDYLDRYCSEAGITFLNLHHPQQGIGHIVAAELGLTQPGIVIAGDDSHTTTNGAFGALALGIGLSEVTHVLATQTVWQPAFKTLRINFAGKLSFAVDAKDIALSLISRIGAGGSIGHFIEYAGECVEAMSMAQRMTICNMAVEAGARGAIIAPDEKTFAYLKGRHFVPSGPDWDSAVEEWSKIRSDEGAVFDRTLTIRADEIPPTVTWGNSPQDAVAVDAVVPDPSQMTDASERLRAEASLRYMGLTPGTPITDIVIDQVFIGSCTNGRIEDLRAAAAIARHGRAVVPVVVVPGSMSVKRQAESEGLHRIFQDAGFEWREPGCSMCLGMNGDLVDEGRRCASTTNRNFVGRQGRGSRTHLMGPAMAAAAGLAGRIADVRRLNGAGGA